jgi:hypothetical protein
VGKKKYSRNLCDSVRNINHSVEPSYNHLLELRIKSIFGKGENYGCTYAKGLDIHGQDRRLPIQVQEMLVRDQISSDKLKMRLFSLRQDSPPWEKVACTPPELAAPQI